jgi:hypothetical protein
MKTNLLLLAIAGIALLIIGIFLIQVDRGSCPTQPPNPGGFSCYHILFGFLPMYPTGLVLLFIGVILLVTVFVLSRKK